MLGLALELAQLDLEMVLGLGLVQSNHNFIKIIIQLDELFGVFPHEPSRFLNSFFPWLTRFLEHLHDVNEVI